MPRRGWPFHPFLLAVYGPLALAASNLDRGVSAGDLVVPLASALLFAAVGVAIGRIATPDRDRGGAVAATVVVVLGFGGLLAQGVSQRPLNFWSPAALRWAGAGLLMLIVGAALLASRSRRDFRPLTRLLNLATAMLLAFVGVRLARAAAARAPGGAVRPVAQAEAPGGGASAARPDVYFIVLDSYSSGAELAAQYGHDNAPFEAELRRRGFVVPSGARANYVQTYLALASALNWSHLDGVARRVGRESANRTLPYVMIEESRAWRFLRERGYRMVFLPTSYGATSRNRHADRVIARRGASEFVSVWAAGTGLKLLARTFRSLDDDERLPFSPEGAAAMRRKLDSLAAVAREPGPKFVLAHLMLPHEPFVFDASCAPRASYWPRSRAEDARWRAAYADQVTCVNRLLLSLVDSLIAGSRTPPVVILQGDHGHGRVPLGRVPPLAEVTREQVRDRTRVFAAYYLPGVPARAVHDSISPVNVWPLLLTHLFATPTALLPDASYWSSWERPYDLTRVE